MTTSQIIYPLRQPDSTSQPNANNLLARPIFEALQQLIGERRDELASVKNGAARLRHGAVLIDGQRGTGKTSVLDNLQLFLESRALELVTEIHILKPIDPTLLEDHDDLFLNIVVAAVLSDKTVKSALEKDSDARNAVYKQLHQLGHALEYMQTQREKKGLDKVRAFIGNQDLLEHIHTFFERVLKLLGKKLLVMPIDDVDTSLHRAFENLEVVRRYLTTPLVLPVISGDAALYHDVTWRDFHGRLLKDSTSQRHDAEVRARELAAEYHRKVLPPQFRLEMPAMHSYFANDEIKLGDDAAQNLSFPQFHAWIEALLNDRTNGVENSYLKVPVPTVRAFGQLVYRLRDLIPDLAKAIAAGNLTKGSIRHYLLMPALPVEAIETFRSDYQSATLTGDETARRNSREVAYAAFARNYGAEDAQKTAGPLSGDLIEQWIGPLLQHFKHERTAGAAFLVVKAHSAWTVMKGGGGDQWNSMFDTPLFLPQSQAREYPDFKRDGDLTEWRKNLDKRVPESWLGSLPEKTILPYPVPEIGPLVSQQSLNAYIGTDMSRQQRLLTELLLHRNFYQRNKTGVLLCVGRIFEIVMTSLLRDVTANDIGTILNRPPFYSFGAIAQTKTLESSVPDEDDQVDAYADPFDLEEEHVQLANDINEWRKEVKAQRLRLSPWLVYNVMNKFFSQAWIFNNPDKAVPVPDSFVHMGRVARKAFNSIWAAFGSFEKGPVYGLPPIVATVNMGEGKDFTRSDLYRQNISPFVGELATQFGLRVGAITAMLNFHPLKKLTDMLPAPGPSAAARVPSDAEAKPTNRRPTRSEWLFSKTGKKQFEAAARIMLTWSAEQRRQNVLDEYMGLYRDGKLQDAYRKLKGQ